MRVSRGSTDALLGHQAGQCIEGETRLTPRGGELSPTLLAKTHVGTPAQALARPPADAGDRLQVTQGSDILVRLGGLQCVVDLQVQQWLLDDALSQFVVRRFPAVYRRHSWRTVGRTLRKFSTSFVH